MRGASPRSSRQELWFMQEAIGLIVPRVIGRISHVVADGTEILGVHLCASADDKTKDVLAAVSFFLTSDPDLPLADLEEQEAIIVFNNGATPNTVRINGTGFIHIWPLRKRVVGSDKRLGVALRFLGVNPMTINAGILFSEP